MNNDRLPPHNVEAEEAVVGSLLLDAEAVILIADRLKPEDFYDERHRWAYEACISLYGRSEAINQITVAQELVRMGKLADVGGAAFLSHTVSVLPTSVHAEYYAQIVSRLSVMRQLISAAGYIATLGYEADPDVESVLSKAEDILFKLRHGESPRDFVHIRKVLEQYFEQANGESTDQSGQPTRLLTGYPYLDDMLGGLQRSDLIILAARPSMGKSSLGLGIARNLAVEHGASVAFFSLEMPKEQLVQRLISGEAGVDPKRLRIGMYTEREERQVLEAAGVLSEASIYIDDSGTVRMMDIRGKSRRLQHDHGLDLIVVDYLQLIREAGKVENRSQEISMISRELKSIARELNIPVIALSQLSRAVEMRTPHIPQLSDLRESGSIEQDADIVLFIYREDVYTTEEEWEKCNPDKPYPRGIANIIIAKHRNGPTGQVDLRFIPQMAKFDNLKGEVAEVEQQALPRFSN